MFSMVGLFATTSVEPRLELEQGLLDNDDNDDNDEDIDIDNIDDYLSTFFRDVLVVQTLQDSTGIQY